MGEKHNFNKKDKPRGTCQYRARSDTKYASEPYYFTGQICIHEPLPGSQFCIFHEEIEKKDNEKCMKLFNNLLREGYRDFRGFKLQKLNFYSDKFTKDMDFSDITVAGVTSFYMSTFLKRCIFIGSKFEGNILFIKANFLENVDFSESIFQGTTDFSNSTFTGNADFKESKFSGDVNFNSSVFKADAVFKETTFLGEVDFIESIFLKGAKFNLSNFKNKTFFSRSGFFGNTYFPDTTFSDVAWFDNSSFSEYAIFSGATFSQNADFRGARFLSKADFWCSEFNGLADFRWTVFTGNTLFKGSEFSEMADFNDSSFLGRANFEGATFMKNADFSKVLFRENGNFIRTKFYNGSNFSGAAFEKRGSFYNSRMSNANFINAELRHVSFKDFDFSNIILDGALIDESYLTGAKWKTDSWGNYLIREEEEAKKAILCCMCGYIHIGDGNKCEFCGNEITDLWSEKQVAFRRAENVYRNIKLSLKNEGDYKKAGKFYYKEMAMRRKQHKMDNKLLKWLGNSFMWLSSGYGERWYQVLFWWIIVILLFGSIYWGCDCLERDVGDVEPLDNYYFSVVTFTTLGFGDIHPKADMDFAKVLSMIEAVIGAILMGLFLFTLARQIMR